MPDPSPDPRRLPRARSVDRIEYLLRLARGRRVTHVGFAGESGCSVADLRDRSTWLHGRLCREAASVVGIDLDPGAVERARAAGFEAHVADAASPEALRRLAVPPAELVVAGEIIEHVETPGQFLDAMRVLVAPGGLLAITTPNAASMLNPMAAAAGYELVQPEHIAFYSWFTLTNLLSRHGWRVRDVATYPFPLPRGAWRDTAAARVGRVLARVQAAAARLWPFVNFGLIVVAEPEGSSGDQPRT